MQRKVLLLSGNENFNYLWKVKTDYNQELIDFIKEHKHLFWYTPVDKKEEISQELLLETILNYGSLKDSLQLIELIGKDKTFHILQSAKGRKKMNYYPEIYNFFMLYLTRKNAQRNT